MYRPQPQPQSPSLPPPASAPLGPSSSVGLAPPQPPPQPQPRSRSYTSLSLSSSSSSSLPSSMVHASGKKKPSSSSASSLSLAAASSSSLRAVSQGFISQGLKMDPVEKMRRWKRSLDGFISFRKAVLLALGLFIFILYLGPSFLGWLFGSGTPIDLEPLSAQSCMEDTLYSYRPDLLSYNAHAQHTPWRPDTDRHYLPYVGNGHLGLSVDDDVVAPADTAEEATEKTAGHHRLHIFGMRHLNVAVPVKPLVQLTPPPARVDSSTASVATVVHYTLGQVHTVRCYQPDDDGGDQSTLSVSELTYAHRAIPQILVQEIKVTNPSGQNVPMSVERPGIVGWEGARTRTKVIEHGEGGHKFLVVSGSVPIPDQSYVKLVSVVMQKLPPSVEVAARMTHTVTVYTSVAYSQPVPAVSVRNETFREALETEAIKSLRRALDLSSVTLRQLHQDVWRSLWTTGFGVSHSMAENAVNGYQINATMYYVLSQVPAPIHTLENGGTAMTATAKDELRLQLAYAEGCYGGHPTLHANSLWKSLLTLEDVNAVVRAWILTLEKNGCNKLLKTGADGVVQAMVLSLVSLSFREDHLELNAHPKDLHRDYFLRRVSYGNATHLNISMVVQDDNRPVLSVALDRRNRDYFACDAGCLDPPNKLSTEVKTFPVKLTDPVTAILYITADHQHMEELKHAIHVKGVVEAPAHEHHVMALHKHGNKLGGLPAIFWFSIGFLIFVFHMFLFKLVWQEYYYNQDNKFRTRKFSDYE